jgi:FtsP/CotA-like multicopper oxidase with cupredoxin domain
MGSFPTRRSLLAASAAFGLLPALPRRAGAAEPIALRIETRTLEVKGRAATVFGILGEGGAPGLVTDAARFQARLENRAGEPTLIHWHGQTPPAAQDGVPDLAQPLLPPGASYSYDFPLRPGTHWMHSHHGLQEQKLMAAPMVVRSDEDRRADEQEVIVLLHDFTFRDPAEVLAGLTGGGGTADPGGHAMAGHGAMTGGHDAMMAMPGMAMQGMAMQGGAMTGHSMGGMDLNDVEYDAYLANDRTLDDPQIVTVERSGRVRLRIINGATTTAFHIDLGGLEGEAIAVDGNPIRPVRGKRFPLAMGQRIDLRLTLPGEGGAWPVLALREGAPERTGIVLATAGAAVTKIAGVGERTPPLDLAFESRLSPLEPLPEKPAARRYLTRLTGSMTPYIWGIDGRPWGRHRPLTVSAGERVEITFVNTGMMPHPMHLHGHHFQVVALDGKTVAGAMRDTVLVPVGGGAVTIAFDAVNPGRWPLHCHNLLHMATGMMTEVAYTA